MKDYNEMMPLVERDPRKRGIANLFFYNRESNGLAHTTKVLNNSKKVGIVTGFYIPGPDVAETDGPLGAIDLAQSLLKLGKGVKIITDTFNIKFIDKAVRKGCKNRAELIELGFDFANYKKVILDLDVLVSIERVGRAEDNEYYNMKGVSITSNTAPLDELFIMAPKFNIKTIGIGDGGNEIGMGNVRDLIKEYILFGERIACRIKTDYLLIVGVSNWGAYILSKALGLVNKKELISSYENQRKLLRIMLKAGAVDGLTKKKRESVDGLDFDNEHKKLFERLKIIG